MTIGRFPILQSLDGTAIVAGQMCSKEQTIAWQIFNLLLLKR
jgi:hypothetical protein